MLINMKRKYKLYFVYLILLAFITVFSKKMFTYFYKLDTKESMSSNSKKINKDNYSLYLYTNCKLNLNTNLENKIITAISNLNANNIWKIRDIKKMENPKMVQKLIESAKVQGGLATGSTYYNNLIIDDKVVVSLMTYANPKELKFINKYIENDTIYNNNTIYITDNVWYKYKAKIKIECAIIVGNSKKTEFYFENSEISSTIKLK